MRIPSFSYYNNGITMRTEQYRITRYSRADKPLIELYDHQKDPEENFNVADDNPAIIKRLMRRWEKGDTGLYRE